MVLLGQKWFYSGNVVFFGRKWLYSGKVVVIGKVVVFGQKWLYFGKRACIQGKRGLHSCKGPVFGQSGCIRKKLVVFVQK